MSNIISFDGKAAPDDDSLAMSNGGTDVFINILALSGSVIARGNKTGWERLDYSPNLEEEKTMIELNVFKKLMKENDDRLFLMVFIVLPLCGTDKCAAKIPVCGGRYDGI